MPAATDDPPIYNPSEDEAYQEEAAEVRREQSAGELYPLTEEHPFPPSHYDRS